jgi:SAM-dependent methyltransferase
MTHYEFQYFQWQKKIGYFGGTANLFKFEPYISTNDNVLEFGCGGGYLLKNIKCKDRIGIEINDSARKIAFENGIQTVQDVSDVPNDWANIIISNHVLEHTFNPLEELKKLHSKLKLGGHIIFVVPQEFKTSFKEKDVNMHLFTWTPRNLGNLFITANYKIIKTKTLYDKWPPFYLVIFKALGPRIFRLISTIYCILTGHGHQTWILAFKE